MQMQQNGQFPQNNEDILAPQVVKDHMQTSDNYSGNIYILNNIYSIFYYLFLFRHPLIIIRKQKNHEPNQANRSHSSRPNLPLQQPYPILRKQAKYSAQRKNRSILLRLLQRPAPIGP